MTQLQLHPLCALFPRMSGAEFEALKEDILINGLRHPIVTYKGLILDGGNRYQACLAVGVKPLMTEYTGDRLAIYAMSANFHRRHLLPGQQAAIVASVQNWANANGKGGDRKSDQSQAVDFDSVEKRASVAGVSRVTQMKADQVARRAPELAVKVAHGEITLPKAVRQITPNTPKPEKSVEIDSAKVADLRDAREAVKVLVEENERLNLQLAVKEMDATEEEKISAEAIITDLRAQVHTLQAELSAVKASRDTYMRENARLMRQVAKQRQELGQV